MPPSATIIPTDFPKVHADACNHCGGELRLRYLPSMDEYTAAYPQLMGLGVGVEPQPLPFDADTLDPRQRAKMGALYRCTTCNAPFRKTAAATPAPVSA